MATKQDSYYDILEVNKSADSQAIKNAYRNMSRKYHPDKLPNESKLFGESKIKEINEAYGVLSDPEKKKIYDRYGKKGLQEGFDPSGVSSSRVNMPVIKVPVKVTLKDLYVGKTVTVDFERKTICLECDRTGAKDKTLHRCTKCGGRGRFIQAIKQGLFIQEQVINCPTCNGLGVDPSTELCGKCQGKSYLIEKCTITQEIPPGTNDNIVISDMGDELPPEIRPPGIKRALVVLIPVQEDEDEIFERCNNGDLLVAIELTLEEALCGFKRVITHLDGRKLAIIQSEPTNFGTRKIIKGEGMKLEEGHGNLVIQFSFKMPEGLNDQQKRSLYSTLTNGKNFDDVDLSVSTDEVYTNLLSDVSQDERVEMPNAAECCIQ